MNTRLRIYLGADQRYEHLQVYEWLLHRAQQAGLPGATASQAVAGFGPNSRRSGLGLDSLSADATMIVEIIGGREEIEGFLGAVQETPALDRALVVVEPVEVISTG